MGWVHGCVCVRMCVCMCPRPSSKCSSRHPTAFICSDPPPPPCCACCSISQLNFKAIVDGLGGVLFKYPFRVPAYYALILRSLTVGAWAGGWGGGSGGTVNRQEALDR